MAKKTEADALQKAGTERAASDPVYTVEEFAAGSYEVFGTSPDLVTAALRSAGIESTTRKEAEALVNAFKAKPVEH